MPLCQADSNSHRCENASGSGQGPTICAAAIQCPFDLTLCTPGATSKRKHNTAIPMPACMHACMCAAAGSDSPCPAVAFSWLLTAQQEHAAALARAAQLPQCLTACSAQSHRDISLWSCQVTRQCFDTAKAKLFEQAPASARVTPSQPSTTTRDLMLRHHQTARWAGAQTHNICRVHTCSQPAVPHVTACDSLPPRLIM
jgi:hypothetical protein